MNTRRLQAVLASAIAFAATGAAAQLSITSNGPYYATPSWDQKLTTGRFVILLNWNSEAVLDRETGLVWQKTPGAGTDYGADSNWYGAMLNCSSVGTGGRYGWRVPSYHEVSSLADSTGALPAGHPFVVGSSQLYWSASISPSDATYVLVRNFAAMPFLDFKARATDTANVWCVRGGQGVNSNW